MPLYEYECLKCKQVHEIMQKFSDAPATECPRCQGPVQKLFSQSSFALKGTGWYTTDYKKSSGSSGSKES
jgi:putative FmdB family regulatory protein